MDKKLKLLFDYQKFENNPKLNTIIKQCEEKVNKFCQKLTDAELKQVAGGKGFSNTYKKRNI